jgi:hypothetical protein
MRTIYSVDKDRIFSGGVLVIGPKEGRPTGWVTAESPPPEGLAQWNENGWEVLGQRPSAFPDVPSAKAAKLDELATIRWTKEEGGTTVGGTPIATDRTTQAKLTAAYVKAAADNTYAIANWKFDIGVFGTLNAATIIAAADAVELHVQACFTNEASLSASVLAASNFSELDAIDLQAGWP